MKIHPILAAVPCIVLWLQIPTKAQAVDILTLRVPSVQGVPGQEVALEFRGTFEVPLIHFQANFYVSNEAAAFIRTEVAGTAASHALPRGVYYNPAFFKGGYMTGVRLDTQSPYMRIEPGEDVVLVKAILRILADAPAGDYPILFSIAEWVNSLITTTKAVVSSTGVLTVLPPSGPRPVGSLECTQEGPAVRLSWETTEPWDSIQVHRGGTLLATLPGAAAGYEDRPAPGPSVYSVTAVREGKESLACSCSILVKIPRPPAPTSLTCSTLGATVHLAWTNEAPYDSIAVFRNGHLLADLPGAPTSHDDPYPSDIFTVYTLIGRSGGIESLPASCRINELSKTFVVWAEEVRAAPGSIRVPVRVFATNPEDSKGLAIGVRVDPSLAAIHELTVDGTETLPMLDQFLYQRHRIQTGDIAAGLYFDSVAPYGVLLYAGADQHVMTVVVDVPAHAAEGTIIPVQIGTFGVPPNGTIFTIQGQSKAAQTRDGAILVGDSPVPEVKGASAEVLAGEPAGGGGETADSPLEGVLLRWSNAAAYTDLRIERNGMMIATPPGDGTSAVDPAPGPGIHHYRIVAIRGAAESFPVAVTARPAGIPGTFLRGDANSDRHVDIADPIAVIQHLYLGGFQPQCLDAADADDSGSLGLADPVTLLSWLFRGADPLPSPGTAAPWFDPTPDALGCR